LLEVVAMELPQKLLLRCCAENAEFGKLMPVLVVPEVPEVPIMLSEASGCQQVNL
jgi:hypothetical protein